MARSETDSYQIDRLSGLPDALLITILSLLPTHTAARNSVLSCRFRHLWKASPSVDLSIKCLPSFKTLTRHARANIYVAMANSAALLSRTSSNSLLRLHLDLGSTLPRHLIDSLICSLLVHAHALGLRHLTIDDTCDFESVLRTVFTISSLESLSIRISPRMFFPSAIALNRLKSLSINLTCNRFYTTNKALFRNSFQKILSELCCLEHLQLHICSSTWSLTSRTIKKLELVIKLRPDSLELFMPSLEFLSLKNVEILYNVPLIHGDIPFIRKTVVTLRDLRPEHTTSVAQFLNCISHVEALSLDLEEDMFSNYPFSVVMEPGKEVPTFSNLKHLDISICFRECNFEAVVTMLHNCPALESLKLYHKRERGARNAWRSKLPCNSDGNEQYVCFKNLHLGDNRNEFKKMLNKICTPNRHR